jgi:hypothetical protein
MKREQRPRERASGRRTKKRSPSALPALIRIRSEFGPARGIPFADRKLALLAKLRRERLSSAKAVHALHETLCFMWAYADDPRVLEAVEDLLTTFAARRDLQQHRAELEGSGIAGTDIVYRFYAEMARWLAACWPSALTVEWDALEDEERLVRLLPHLVLPAEAACMEELVFSARDWCERLKGPDETDATFLVRRIERLALSPLLHEMLYQDLGLWLRLAPQTDPPGEPTPSRTLSRIAGWPRSFQSTPLRRARPDLAVESERPPLAIRALSRDEGAHIIDMARVAMVTRSRDLDAFSYGDPDDVRMVEHEDGLAFAAVGVRPERRLLFEAVYAFLTLKNGVPIGYVLNSALYGSAEIAYNVFETFRGGEAGHIYGRVVSTLRALFGCDSFTIYPYQLGDDNEEALESGAWWFYQKLGFRPKAPAALKLIKRELARMKQDREHRTSIETLRELARENMYWHSGPDRDDVVGMAPFGDAGLAVADLVAARFGSDRERATEVCAEEAARLCGGVDDTGWTPAERNAWRRFAPVIVALPGVARWTEAERAALVPIARAKGGQRESDFVRAFDAHPALRKAVLGLVARAETT